jgi:hypothetical protein
MSQLEAQDELERGTAQKEDETVEALGNRIQSLVSKSFPMLRGRDKAYQEKRYFIQNLADKATAKHLKMTCGGDSFTDVVEKATIAALHEKSEKKEDQNKPKKYESSKPFPMQDSGKGRQYDGQRRFGSSQQQTFYNPGMNSNYFSGNQGGYDRGGYKDSYDNPTSGYQKGSSGYGYGGGPRSYPRLDQTGSQGSSGLMQQQQVKPLQLMQPPPQSGSGGGKYPSFQQQGNPKEGRAAYATLENDDDIFMKEENGKFTAGGLGVGIARKQDERESSKEDEKEKEEVLCKARKEEWRYDEKQMMPGKGCKFKEVTAEKEVTTEKRIINGVKRTLARNRKFLCKLQSKVTLNEEDRRIEADCKWRIEALEANLEDDMARMKSCANAEVNPEVKQNPMTTKVKGKQWDDNGGW